MEPPNNGKSPAVTGWTSSEGNKTQSKNGYPQYTIQPAPIQYPPLDSLINQATHLLQTDKARRNAHRLILSSLLTLRLKWVARGAK